jgi:hypothetical protein
LGFIDDNRDEFRVEPICGALQVAPSTYYATKARLLSTRAIRDAVMIAILVVLWGANYRLTGRTNIHQTHIVVSGAPLVSSTGPSVPGIQREPDSGFPGLGDKRHGGRVPPSHQADLDPPRRPGLCT